MNRRMLLKVTGLLAIAGAAVTLPRVGERRPTITAVTPSATRLTMQEPGTYRISGRVRLDAPQVEINGITHTQRISWSSRDSAKPPIATFTTFEHFDGAELTRTIRVRGGHLESVTSVPMDFA
ncbi:MAG: hypothetical protein AB7R89_31575 [Dehalococcoidia bacterium]